MKKISVVLALLWATVSWAGSPYNLNSAHVILEGFDAVSYFPPGQPMKGDPKFQVQRDGATYWFSSQENKEKFLKEPTKYEPQFGGWCAYAVADSQSKVKIDPKSFLIQDGRLLLFYNGLWGNTREKWLHTKSKDPKSYLKEADAHWPAVKPKDP